MPIPHEFPYYSSRILVPYDGYIRKHFPQVDMRAIYEFSGISPSQISDLSHWFTQQQVNRFYEKAAELTANPDLARDVGRTLGHSNLAGALRLTAMATGGPATAYSLIPRLASYMTKAVTISYRRTGPSGCELITTPHPGVQLEQFQCENSKGSFEAIASVFNTPVKLEHPECVLNGASHCRYLLEWELTPSEGAFRLRNVAAATLALGLALASPFLSTTGLWTGAAVALGSVLALTYRAHRLLNRELRQQLEKVRTASELAIETAQNQYNNALIVNELGTALSRQVARLVALRATDEKDTRPSLDLQINSLLEEPLRILQRHLGFERGFFLFATETGQLTYRAGIGLSSTAVALLRAYGQGLPPAANQPIEPNIQPNIQNDPILRCLHEQKPVVRNSDFSSIGSARLTGLAAALGCQTFVACPIVNEKQSLGVLLLDNTVSHKPFPEREVRLLLGIAPSVAISIQNVLLGEKAAELARLELERAALQKDLEVTGAVQSMLLPKQRAVQADGLAVHTYFEPATQSGGDWWWHERLTDGRYRILVADVTGHGAGSAMVTAMVAASYTSARATRGRDLEMSELLPLLNTTVHELCGEQYWVAFVVLEIDLKNGTLRLGGAGMPPLFIEHRDGALESIPLPPGNLGTGTAHFEVRDYPFARGERLLLCTDGAFEFAVTPETTFGRRRLQKTFAATRGLPMEARLPSLVAELRAARRDPSHFEDDVTLVLVERADETS